MFKQLIKAGVLSAGLVLGPLGASTAGALPAAKGPVASDGGQVILARKGGGRGFGGGGGGGGFKAMGGGRSFGGRSFGSRSFGPGRSFSRRSFGGGRVGGIPRSMRHAGGGKHWHGGRGHRHHKHRHRRIYGYYPYYGAAYYGGYGYGYGDCGWLRRKAIRTGSSYWWRRYESCVAGYY